MKLSSRLSYTLVGILLSGVVMSSAKAEPEKTRHLADIVVSAHASSPAGIAANVPVHGCVVDNSYVPRVGAVIVRSQDGRLITRVLSGSDGTFVVRVPPQQRIHLLLDVPGGDTLTVAVGGRDTAIDNCLREDVD